MSTTKSSKQNMMGVVTDVDFQYLVGEIIIGGTNQVASIGVPEQTRQLSDTQLTALDLYERGFNTFPLKPYQKKPFILKPLYTSRLHHCTPACNHRGKFDITEMFRRKNIGVVLGKTSGNLIAIDCDSPLAFEKMGQELTARNLLFWAISGHRGGAYLLRVKEGEIAENKPADKSGIPDVEVWGTRRYIVLPPSIHPEGTVYQWVTPEPRFSFPKGETLPAVSIRDLEWLGLKIRSKWVEPELFGLPAWAAGLSYRNRRRLTGKFPRSQRNNQFFKAASDMKANDVEYDEAEVWAIEFAKRNILADESYSEYMQGILDSLKSAYSVDRTPARESRRDNLKEWERAQVVSDSFDWYGAFGRKALRRRAAYNALIERARIEGKPLFRATEREIAEIGNMNKETANKALHDLMDVGLIQKAEFGRRTDAGIYSFVWETTVENRPGTTTGRYSGRVSALPKTLAEKDVARKIGMVGWYAWQYLLIHPAKGPKEIADALGLKRSSVGRALKFLKHDNVGLVMHADGVYYGEPKTDASLAEMAIYWHEGASPAKNRKEAHKLERELRANKLVIGAISAWEKKYT